MQQTGQHQTFYEEIKCFINFLKAISSILEKLLLYSREKIEIFSCQNSNKLPTIMFIRQGDNFKTISFIFQVGIIESCLHQRYWNFSTSETVELCRNSNFATSFEKLLGYYFEPEMLDKWNSEILNSFSGSNKKRAIFHLF